MKGNIEVLFFNGISTRSTVDVRIAGRVSLFQESASSVFRPPSDVFSEAAVSLAVSAVGHVLETALGGNSWQQLSFRADSLILEELATQKAVPDPFHVAQLLAAAVLISMLSDIDASGSEDDPPLLCEAHSEDELYEFLSGKFSARLNEHATRLRESLTTRRSKEPHPLLLRAEALEKSGAPDQSFDLLKTLNPEQLDYFDCKRWYILKLKTITRLDLTDNGFRNNQEQYDAMCVMNRHDSEVLCALAFIWIRYLQNRREFCKAMKEVERFSQEFSESRLSASEIAVIDYLRGRSEYHQGEYIGALEKLDRAFRGAGKSELEFRSDILNTAASSFTDNLFFDHASFLLDETLRIRDQLALAKRVETLSAMGCVAFKRADFARASELFSKTLLEMRKTGFIEDESRILNYTAKAAVFNGDYQRAFDLIEEATQGASNKKSVVFSNAIRMAYLVHIGDFDVADVFFKKTIMLPESHTELFAAAWGYFFEAEACYRLGKNSDALKYQARSVNLFFSDRYILEAGISCIAPLLWDLSKKDRVFFEKLIDNVDIISKLSTYKEIHRDLPRRFFVDLFSANFKNDDEFEPLLSTIIENIISAKVYESPEKAQNAMKSVCLL